MLSLLLLKLLHESLGFLSRLFGKVLFDEQQRLRLSCFHGLLQSKHLIANVVTHLSRALLVLELFPTAKFEDTLTLLIRTLLLAAPLVVLLDFRKLNQVFTVVTFDLEQLYKFFKNVRARPHAHWARTLERAALLPPSDAFLAE